MKFVKVRSDVSAVRKKITMIAAVVSPMAVNNPFPARVSAILRSSVRTSRLIGIPGVPERSSVGVASFTAVLMPRLLAEAVLRSDLLTWPTVRCAVALGLGGQLKEELLQPRTLGR